MRTIQYPASIVEKLLKAQKIATLPALQSALGAKSKITVFRKLKSLFYLSSYSHAGEYYTLPAIARFNDQGLWSCRGVWFSAKRTLKPTLESLVTDSRTGYYESELEKKLHVMVRGALLNLLRAGRIDRVQAAGRYLYVAAAPAARARQSAAREEQDERTPAGYEPPGPQVLHHEMKAAIVLFFSQLNEKQRRLYAGVESLKAGRGGDQLIAKILGLDPGTVAKGRGELLARDIEIERIRKAGGGRDPLQKKISRSMRLDSGTHEA